MNLNSCIPGCNPTQIVNFNIAINDITSVNIEDDCGNGYNNSNLEFAYSLDNVCWSCYMTYEQIIENTIELTTDFYIRIKVPGAIQNVYVNGNKFLDYSVSLAQGFTLVTCGNNNQNLYNPYANTDCAMQLYLSMAESVSCMVGIPIYYIKLTPNKGSKDITFKEYALMGVEDVKQIKLIISDGTMPSSASTVTDYGWDWEADWETEVSKATFATAFGNTAQPMEGDLIYVPMMKRMWMVNEAYEEKNEGFMWNSATFKLMLVKYQEKGSVDLGEAESFVNEVVKNKYADLFGDEEFLGSGFESVEAPVYSAAELYPVFRSDATRKYMTCTPIDIIDATVYHKNTLIISNYYKFNDASKIIYQKQYCGNTGSASFIIKTNLGQNYDHIFFEIADIKLHIKQTINKSIISLVNNPNVKVEIENTELYFVYLRWSKELNLIELNACIHICDKNVPSYKLRDQMYYFNIDNPIKSISKWTNEMEQECKKDVCLYDIKGELTNIKLFDTYIDNIGLLIQMYPTHNHLLFNDTARKVVDGDGVALK